jgi:hypothetical protein
VSSPLFPTHVCLLQTLFPPPLELRPSPESPALLVKFHIAPALDPNVLSVKNERTQIGTSECRQGITLTQNTS